MRNTPLALLALLFIAPASSHAIQRLIPAGSLIQCTIAEPKLSSKTADIGDPVLCEVGYSERSGRSVLPYDSYLVGRFEDYKDPGHFVGKGWMELAFDRMIIEPDTVIPVNARVVDVPGYRVDREGRILGKGHAVRDAVEWTIPILWPIDVLTLPRRGPRPTLKRETRLTLKVMDDLGIPDAKPLQQDPSGLMHRAPASYEPPPEVTYPPPGPVVPVYAPVMPAPPPPLYWWYAVPPPPVVTTWGPVSSNAGHRRPPYMGSDARQPVTLIFNDGRPPEQAYNYMLTATAVYVLDGDRQTIPLRELDLASTMRANRQAGVDFRVPGSVYGE
jgi:hypothetical protein